MKIQLQKENVWSKMLSGRTFRILFIAILAILIAAFFIQVITTTGVSSAPVFFQDTRDTFMDFFNVQKSIAELSPVAEGIYPPLSYVMLLPFNSFVNYDFYSSYGARNTQAGRMSIVIFLMIWLFMAAVFMSKITSRNRKQSSIIVFLLFLSAPMLFLIERGNINVSVLAFLSVFFAYYEDDSVWLREVAILALAVATGIKIYPALFGLLLIKRDTIFYFLRLALYCIALIVLPTFFFEGGLNNIKIMISNIMSYSDTFASWPDWLALRSVMGYGAMFRAIGVKLDIGQDWFIMAGRITTYVMLIGSLIGSFFVNEKWKKTMLLACPIVLFPAMSGIYNIVFLFIPIIFFLKEEEHNKIDYLYMLLFLIVLNSVQYGNWLPMVARSTIVSNICVITINVLLCMEGFVGFVKMVHAKLYVRNVV